ncbi:MAG: tRNA epoxyqueuosine(34) reductase QueG [Planctomycetota bacterium]|nr:MAG: tRNA epoxyqueuosine(34) reductase QueG [Planctomycetota bacterium]
MSHRRPAENDAAAGTAPPEPQVAGAVDPVELAEAVRGAARRLGFSLVGIAPAVDAPGWERLRAWVDAGMAGAMDYVARRLPAYRHPQNVLPGVRSVVMLGMDYHTPARRPVEAGYGRVSSYAWGSADYHDVIRGRLRRLAGVLHERVPGCRTRGVVDTAPLLERDFARLAGLGWFGKNTMLINKRRGSFFFLAALLTDVPLAPDEPFATAHCGTCTRCIDACPTEAIRHDGTLDARRCISYLTIELRDRPIPEDLRGGLGDWVFGCDVCQDVCPWNRHARPTTEPAFEPRPDLNPLELTRLFELDEAAFRERFGDTPLARPGRSGILRNAAIVLGNTGDARFVEPLAVALNDPDAIVRGAAAWALGCIGGAESVAALRRRAALESDPEVAEEITRALRAAIGTDAVGDGEAPSTTSGQRAASGPGVLPGGLETGDTCRESE